MKILDKINAMIVNVSAIFLGVMVLLVLVQVFYRYVLNDPLPESQELSIYAMVYVIMLGCTIAVKNKTHIAVELVQNLLPEKFAFFVRQITYFFMFSFFGILLVQGWKLTVRSMPQLSPSTGIPVGYILFSIPLCAFISILYIIKHAIDDIKKRRNDNIVP